MKALDKSNVMEYTLKDQSSAENNETLQNGFDLSYSQFHKRIISQNGVINSAEFPIQAAQSQDGE